MGVPPNHPIFNIYFCASEKPSSYWGISIYGNPQYEFPVFLDTLETWSSDDQMAAEHSTYPTWCFARGQLELSYRWMF